MPIVSEKSGGLRRYAVFSFVEDVDSNNNRKNKSLESKKKVNDFLQCPLTSPMEAASKLTYTEMFHMKRLVSIEKGVVCPYVDITFFTSFEGVDKLHGLVGKRDCINLHDPKIKLQKALYEELQLVDPKRDMINTPIDADDPIGNLQTHGVKSYKTTTSSPDGTKALRGYIVIAYKTMEDMYNRDFVKSWKTWTGVRYICMQLPRQLGLRRISFYRQLSKTSSFQYVLCIDISNLLVYAAETLNLMDRIKLRLCGNVGVYREIDFKLDPATLTHLNLPHQDLTPTHSILSEHQTPKINVSRYNSKERSIDDNSNEEISLPETPLPAKRQEKIPVTRKTAVAGNRRASLESLSDSETPKKPQKSASPKKTLKKEDRSEERFLEKHRSLPKKEQQIDTNRNSDRRQEESPSKEPDRYHSRKQSVPRDLPSLPSSESVTTSTDVSAPQKEIYDAWNQNEQKSTKDHRIDIESLQNSEKYSKALGLEVHPISAPKPSRFAGQGRICNKSSMLLSQHHMPSLSSDDISELHSQSTEASSATMAQLRRQSLLSNSANPVKLPYSGYMYSHRIYGAKSGSGSAPAKSHNVVADLPSARETAKPAYESIFKRGGGDYQIHMPDFATIAARTLPALTENYNSPVFSRDEWKKESPLYRSKTRGDQAIHILADQLNISQLEPEDKTTTQSIKTIEEEQPMLTKAEQEVLAAASIIEAKLHRRSMSLSNKNRDAASSAASQWMSSGNTEQQDYLNGNPQRGSQAIRFQINSLDQDDSIDKEDEFGNSNLRRGARRSIATEREILDNAPSRTKHHSINLDLPASVAMRSIFSSHSPPTPSKRRSFFPLAPSPKTSDEDRLSAPRGPKKKQRTTSPNINTEGGIGSKYRSRSGSRRQKTRKHTK